MKPLKFTGTEIVKAEFSSLNSWRKEVMMVAGFGRDPSGEASFYLIKIIFQLGWFPYFCLII